MAQAGENPPQEIIPDPPENLIDLDAARDERWTDGLFRTPSGTIRPLLLNALIALRKSPALKGMLQFNEFNLIVKLVKAPPWAGARGNWTVRAWNDHDDNLLTEWMQKHGILITAPVASAAATTIAKEKPHHPVHTYLRGLRWDEKPRLDKWLKTYLGADDTDYHTAVGSRWLVSAVARIMSAGEGVKADCVLVLEGEQGTLKSSAIEMLAKPWFTDEISQFGSKDTSMQLSGRWIIEIPELSGFREASLETLKAFLSRSIDRFRPPYGRHVIDSPRQCVFAATTNETQYLRDASGDRRFWPVACGWIDLKKLKSDRDQIWAEAFHRYELGAKWWLETEELQKLAEEAQSQRFEMDPWAEKIKAYLGEKSVNGFSTKDILEICLEFPTDRQNKGHSNRIGRAMKHLGYKPRQVGKGPDRGKWLWRKRV